MHVRRSAAFGQLSPQTASPAASLAPRAASALQFLLRCRWLPISEDTTFTTVSRPQGLPHSHRGADLNYAAWRQRGANAAADPSHWRQPPHDSALRMWWRDAFTATPFWQAARASVMPPVDEARLPTAMLERFAGDAAERMTALLRFLSPITGGQVQAL